MSRVVRHATDDAMARALTVAQQALVRHVAFSALALRKMMRAGGQRVAQEKEIRRLADECVRDPMNLGKLARVVESDLASVENLKLMSAQILMAQACRAALESLRSYLECSAACVRVRALAADQ